MTYVRFFGSAVLHLRMTHIGRLASYSVKAICNLAILSIFWEFLQWPDYWDCSGGSWPRGERRWQFALKKTKKVSTHNDVLMCYNNVLVWVVTYAGPGAVWDKCVCVDAVVDDLVPGIWLASWWMMFCVSEILVTDVFWELTLINNGVGHVVANDTHGKVVQWVFSFGDTCWWVNSV